MTTAASGVDSIYNHGERLAALILDLVDGFMLVANRASLVAYASSNLPKYLGCTADEVRLRPLAELLHSDDRGILQPYLDRLDSLASKPALPNRVRFRLEVNSAAVTCVDAIVKLQQFPFSEEVHEPALVCVCRAASLGSEPPGWSQNSAPAAALSAASTPGAPSPSPVAPGVLSSKALGGGVSGGGLPQQAEIFVCELNLPDTRVLRSACSPQLTANRSILADFFVGKQWSLLVAQCDRPIWQKHLETSVSSSDRPASSIYRCQVAPGRVAFVKTSSRMTGPCLLRSTHSIVGECGGDQGAQRTRMPPARTASESVLLDLLNNGSGGGNGSANGTANGPGKRGAPADLPNGAGSLDGGPPPPKFGALASQRPQLTPPLPPQAPPVSVHPPVGYQPSGGFAAQMKELSVPPNVRLAAPELPQDVVDTILAMEDQRATRQFNGVGGSSGGVVAGIRVGPRTTQDEASASTAAAPPLPSRVPSGLLEKLLSA